MQLKFYCPNCGTCANDKPDEFSMLQTYSMKMSFDDNDYYSEGIEGPADIDYNGEDFHHETCGASFKEFRVEEIEEK